MKVEIDSTVLASATGTNASFDQVVSLAAWEEKQVKLHFPATDTQVRALRAIWSPSSTRTHDSSSSGRDRSVTETIATNSIDYDGYWPVDIDIDSAGKAAWSWPDPTRNATLAIYFYDGSTFSRLSPGTAGRLTGLVVEGGDVVYNARTSTGSRAPIFLATSATIEELDTCYGVNPPDPFFEALPRVDYRRSSGWTAILRSSAENSRRGRAPPRGRRSLRARSRA